MYDTYATDKAMRINLGIRRRLAPMMENDRAIAEMDCCYRCTANPPGYFHHGSQPPPNAQVDAHSFVGRVGVVHVVALYLSHHLQRQLVMIAQKDAPLADLRYWRCLFQDVNDRLRSSSFTAMNIRGIRGSERPCEIRRPGQNKRSRPSAIDLLPPAASCSDRPSRCASGNP